VREGGEVEWAFFCANLVKSVDQSLLLSPPGKRIKKCGLIHRLRRFSQIRRRRERANSNGENRKDLLALLRAGYSNPKFE